MPVKYVTTYTCDRCGAQATDTLEGSVRPIIPFPAGWSQVFVSPRAPGEEPTQMVIGPECRDELENAIKTKPPA
jgi:hypothetical protein